MKYMIVKFHLKSSIIIIFKFNTTFSFDLKVKPTGPTTKEYRGNGGKAP